MSTIAVQCPTCQTTLRLARTEPGTTKCKCPKCAALFEVALEAPASSPEAPAPSPGKAANTGVRAPAKTCLETSAPPPPVPIKSSKTQSQAIAKTRLEMPATPTTAVTPPPMKPMPVTDGPGAAAPAAAGAPARNLYAIVGIGIALVGLLSMSCVGVGIWAYFESQKDKGQVAVVEANEKDPIVKPSEEEIKQPAVQPKKQPLPGQAPAKEPGPSLQPEPGVSENPGPGPVEAKPELPTPIQPGFKEPPPAKGGTKGAPGGKKGKNPTPPEASGPRIALDDQRLTDAEWAGRASIIPFDAVATRERLEEIKVVRIRGKGKFTGALNVNDLVLTWESLKRVHFEETNPLMPPSTMLLIRNHGWSRKGKNILPLEGDGLAFYQNFQYGTILSNLIPLTEEGFDVKKGEDVLVRGKECSTAIVTRLERPAMKLYFSKETNLLFKSEFAGRFLDSSNRFAQKATFVEFYFSDYRFVDGVKHWFTQEQWRDNKKYSELKLTQVVFLKKADDSMFTVPGLEDRVRQVMAEYRLADKKAAIARAVAKLGPDAGSDFTRLVKGLNHADANLRPLAQGALHVFIELSALNLVAPLARPDVPSLVFLLQSGPDAELRFFAMDWAARLGPQAAETAPPLVNIAQAAPEPKVLTAALVALKAVGAKTDDALTLFESNLDHADTAVKDAAALALLNLGPQKLKTDGLIKLMGRPHAEIRATAEKLLRQNLANPMPKNLPELRLGLSNPIREVCLVYIDTIALLKTEGQDAAEDLSRLAGSPDREISKHALGALDGMGKLLQVARDNADPAVLKAALGALMAKSARSEDALAIYEKHCTHPDGNVKDAATLALLNLGPERLQIERLTEMMAGSNDEVRAAADKLLRNKLRAPTAKQLPKLRKGLESPVVEVRLAFIDAIGLLKENGKEAAPDLGPLVNSPVKDVAVHACRALESLGKAGKEAAPDLARGVESDDRAVALAATIALCKVDSKDPILKGKGIDLLLEDLTPNAADLKSLLTQPIKGRSGPALIDLGATAVAPMVKQLLQQNNPKGMPQNQKPEPTAARLVGYELLRGFAERAKVSKDSELSKALLKYEGNLKVVWQPTEATIANAFKNNNGIPAEVRQLYVATARSVDQAYQVIRGLPSK